MFMNYFIQSFYTLCYVKCPQSCLYGTHTFIYQLSNTQFVATYNTEIGQFNYPIFNCWNEEHIP